MRGSYGGKVRKMYTWNTLTQTDNASMKCKCLIEGDIFTQVSSPEYLLIHLLRNFEDQSSPKVLEQHFR